MSDSVHDPAQDEASISTMGGAVQDIARRYHPTPPCPARVIDDKVPADDAFVILQQLVAEVAGEIEGRATNERPAEAE